MPIFLDTETFSETPITHGTYRYAETAEIMVLTCAFGDDDVQCYDLTTPAGKFEALELLEYIKHDCDLPIVAHNAMFDRNVLRLGNLKFEIPIERWRCSMVRAYAHGLPGGLDKLCDLFDITGEDAKLKTGKNLIQLFCKPRPKNMKLRRATRDTHPDDWAEFLKYATADIPPVRQLWNRKLPSWNYGERDTGKIELDLWHRDQRMNDRGVAVDLPLVRQALRATAAETRRLGEQIIEATVLDDVPEGCVQSANQRDRLVEFILKEYGLGLADLKKATVSKLIEDENTPGAVRELLLIRAQASQTSTAKYKAFERATSADGRLRGMIQFNGAARTMRDGGRTVQLQNLPSRGLLDAPLVTLGIDALMAECEDLAFDNVMHLCASTIRAALVAAPGSRLVVGDLSNIEGRGLAWLAGEEWVLKAYREYDAGHGEDLYKLAFARMVGGVPSLVSKGDRQIGKVNELACIAEGTLVLTDTGLVPIEDVTHSMRVWDGVQFVEHSGVAYRGYREVFEYDGLVATEDHIVFVEDASATMPFVDAARLGLPLTISGCGVFPVAVPVGFYHPLTEAAAGLTRPYMAQTYDILNAGPRNRFTAGGRLVHNCGYGGGIMAFATFSTAYGLDLEVLARHAQATIDTAVWSDSEGFVTWLQKSKGQSWPMSFEAAVACNAFKMLWRTARPKTVELWDKLQELSVDAIRNPGEVFTYGDIAFKRTGSWLRIRRPSGRVLCYPMPEIDASNPSKPSFSYMGINQYTRQWARLRTYGGKIAENLTQAISRDLMFDTLAGVEDDGYAMLFRVHDELVTETTDDPQFNATGLCAAMTRVPVWAKGMPLAAEGFVAQRYKK